MKILCNNCIFECKQCKTECVNFEANPTKDELKKLNDSIKYQRINLHDFCKDNNMSFEYLAKMLKGKIHFTWKSLQKLENRLNESIDWTYEQNRFDNSNKEMAE